MVADEGEKIGETDDDENYEESENLTKDHQNIMFLSRGITEILPDSVRNRANRFDFKSQCACET